MIHMQGVGLVYPDGTRALRGIDLHIGRGEFAFIVGASGSGKSSLAGLIYREHVASEGRVVVGGQDVAQLPPNRVPALRRKVGVIFQDYRLLPDRTASENIGFALDVMGVSRADKHRRVPIALELVGLGDKGNSFPHQLSGGEQQRVCIARALVNTPPVLVADEPTGNLDPDTSWDIVQLLAQIAEDGTTVVVATHDKYIVDRLNRRVISLVQGTIVRDAREGGTYDGS
ncbi:MAG: cell division ATP-binding protein FtsE [Armatimonadetes bacterium]|nr:cell division ATP-binding protein FtsE [Armatimonadota bacterium]